MHVVNILKQRAKEYAHRPAVIFGQEQISFAELKDKVFSLAQGLLKLGVKRGDKVAIYLPNWPEYIYSYLAIWCIGACSVPLDFMLTEDEIISCLNHSEAKIIITKHKANISFLRLKASLPSLKHIISCRLNKEEASSFEELLAEGSAKAPELKVEEKDYAIIFYTSGTTGKPKGVLINYIQLDAPAKSMAFFVNADLSSSDVTLCALPFSHLGGLIYIQNTITFGLTLVLMERFMPLDFLKNVQNHKVNFFWIVPSMYYAILQLKEFDCYFRRIEFSGCPAQVPPVLPPGLFFKRLGFN
jgi:long-chain acyl-CoA synthetase